MRSLRHRFGVKLVSVALGAGLSISAAWAAGPALQVSEDGSGDVTVNGVVFEAAHGLTSAEIVALIERAETMDTTWMIDATPELAKDVSDVLEALAKAQR